jgi:predicted esterase
VLVAVHGNYDRPEWQCQVYREIVEADCWVLCPRGQRRSDAPKDADRWTYVNAARLGEEIDAGLAALKKEEPDYVDESAPILAGFSLGAIFGATLLVKSDQPFSRVIMVEGGFSRWNRHTAGLFQKAGGRRVLFAAGQPSFLAQAKQAKKVLEGAGVEAAIAPSKNVGHTYDGPVADGISQQFSWLVAGDARFAAGGALLK